MREQTVQLPSAAAYVATHRDRAQSEPVRRLQAVLTGLLDKKPTLRVLEAGCGSGSHLDLGPTAYLVGIDISEKQLLRNTQIAERILGDIQTYDLPASSFDLVVCWDVLEHLPHPKQAIRHFVQATKAGGLIVLGLPNVLSIKGLVTKLTPHAVHVWVWRHLFGNRLAGTEDVGPFRTYLRLALAPPALKRFARRQDLAVVFFSLHESAMHRRLRERYGLTGMRFEVLRRAVKLLTLGQIDAHLTDYVIVLQKREGG